MKNSKFKSNYGDLYYSLWEVANKPTIVFVHGVGMDHKTFDEQVAALIPYYGILTWDLPGHGSSSLKNYNKRYTELAADCMDELLVNLNIKEACFVGQSLGSMIVQHFLIKYPEKVMATIHVPGIELKSHAGSWARKLVPAMMFLINLIPTNTFYTSFGKHRAIKKNVQDYLSETMGKTGKKLALAITKDMTYDLIDKRTAPEKKPLFISYGEKDLFFIRNAAKKWHKREPHSQCLQIPNANHIANQDNPEAFNAALIRFVKKVESQAKHQKII